MLEAPSMVRVRMRHQDPSGRRRSSRLRRVHKHRRLLGSNDQAVEPSQPIASHWASPPEYSQAAGSRLGGGTGPPSPLGSPPVESGSPLLTGESRHQPPSSRSQEAHGTRPQ